MDSWLRIDVLERVNHADTEGTPVTDSSRTCLRTPLTLSLIISNRFLYLRGTELAIRRAVRLRSCFISSRAQSLGILLSSLLLIAGFFFGQRIATTLRTIGRPRASEQACFSMLSSEYSGILAYSSDTCTNNRRYRRQVSRILL